MIPKILHQMWIGPKKAPVKMMDTWRHKNPLWEYKLWTEETLRQEFPCGLENQKQFDEMPEWNGKCDIARYEVLRKYGGFFVDADSICLRSLEEFLLNNESFSCYESEQYRKGLIASGYLGCIPQSRLMEHIIDEISELSGEKLHPRQNSAWETVGPGMLTTTIHKYKYLNIIIYPSFYFIPLHYADSSEGYSGPFKPFAEQYWGSCPLVTDFTYDD